MGTKQKKQGSTNEKTPGIAVRTAIRSGDGGSPSPNLYPTKPTNPGP
jgi:hypothetical protein